jgi:hypothetical protein
MVPACFFYSLKEVLGYKMLCVREILVGEAVSGPRGALSGGVVVGTVEAWRRYSWYCCYMLRHVCHYWREWFLSFGIVATCLVIPGPVAGVEYRSLQFDLT